MEITGRLAGLSSFWGPKKKDESHSSMIARLFSMLYLHFNKHLHNIKSLCFRKKKQGSQGWVHWITQIPFRLCVLCGVHHPNSDYSQEKKNYEETLQRSSYQVMITLLLKCSTFQSRSEIHLMPFRLVTCICISAFQNVLYFFLLVVTTVRA